MKKVVDGNKACAEAAYLFSEIAAIYPITEPILFSHNIKMTHL